MNVHISDSFTSTLKCQHSQPVFVMMKLRPTKVKSFEVTGSTLQSHVLDDRTWSFDHLANLLPRSPPLGVGSRSQISGYRVHSSVAPYPLQLVSLYVSRGCDCLLPQIPVRRRYGSHRATLFLAERIDCLRSFVGCPSSVCSCRTTA